VYILLAAIVLLLLFAASYGGRRTWVALASTTLSVLLVAGCAFIANARSAGPYFNAVAAQTPALFSSGIQDLALAAERISASQKQAHRRAPAETLAQAAAAPPPPAPPPRAAAADDGVGANWFDLSGLDPSDWLLSVGDWLNPMNWFEAQKPGQPEVDLMVQQGAETTAAAPAPPETQAPQAPMPTVRALMQDQSEAQGQRDTAQQQAAAAPSYRIVTAPPQAAAPVTAPLPQAPGAPVKWLVDASAPTDMDKILLTGTNISSTPLENIQAVLKPDPDTTSIGIENVALRLRVDGQDGMATPETSIPPGARFHLEAADLSKSDARQLGGAILSFAYSQGGRRRASIMYLQRTALSGPPAAPQ